jgi:Ser/Thr protein kinase RdoA (MazF antagonist)
VLAALGPRPSFPPLADLATRPDAGLDERSIAGRLRGHRELAYAIHAERDAVFGELASLEPATLPRTLIHGDFNAGNLLFRQGRLTGLLDFDHARPDARAADLAIATIYLGSAADTNALVAGYAQTGGLEDSELAGLAIFRRARRLEHIGFCLGLHNLDTAVLGEIGDTVATIARERYAGRMLSAGAAGGRPGR